MQEPSPTDLRPHRFRLREFEDSRWCPPFIRNGMTGYLEALFSLLKPYNVTIELIAEVLTTTGESAILDLCSGSGGPWASILGSKHPLPFPLTVTLSDKFPNVTRWTNLQAEFPESIRISPESFDARYPPQGVTAFRTLFTSFHHFAPEDGAQILGSAIAERAPIAIFEVTERQAHSFGMIALSPLMYLLLIPFMPRWSARQFVCSTLLPIIPLAIVWDGIVSCLNSYRAEELRALAEQVSRGSNYLWRCGRKKQFPLSVTYLIGVPREKIPTPDGDSDRCSHPDSSQGSADGTPQPGRTPPPVRSE